MMGYMNIRHALAVILLCSPAMAHELRIEHVAIVSPERVAPLRDATVTIKGDRIVSITASKSTTGNSATSRTGATGHSTSSKGATSKGIASGTPQVINGMGLYLTPGLIDSHVHTSDPPGIGDLQAQAAPEVVRAIREQTPRSYLLFGYTTLIDLISTGAQATRWNAQTIRPDLYFCGAAQNPRGYPPIKFVTEDDRQALLKYMIIQRGDEAEAPPGTDPTTHTPEAVIAQMKSDGALCVKTFYERGYGEVDEWRAPRLDTIRELVAAAHKNHMPVLIHANGTDSQEFAVQTGADIIAHGLWHWNREQSATDLTPRARKILDDALKANMGWQPTMQVLYGLRDLFDPEYLSDPRYATVMPASAIQWYRSPQGQWFHDILATGLLSKPADGSEAPGKSQSPRDLQPPGDPRADWKQAQAALAPPITRARNATHYMAAHGARILFGTDTPSAPTYANPPGLNGRREMQRMVEAGMTPLQVFRAATQANAEVLGLAHDIGTVQPGKRANLLLLRADPTQTVDAYDSIVKVILHGNVLDPAELAANHVEAR